MEATSGLLFKYRVIPMKIMTLKNSGRAAFAEMRASLVF